MKWSIRTNLSIFSDRRSDLSDVFLLSHLRCLIRLLQRKQILTQGLARLQTHDRPESGKQEAFSLLCCSAHREGPYEEVCWPAERKKLCLEEQVSRRGTLCSLHALLPGPGVALEGQA